MQHGKLPGHEPLWRGRPARLFASVFVAALVVGGITRRSPAQQVPLPTPAASGAAHAAGTSPAKPAFVRTIEGVSEYRLANGLQVLLLPDPAAPKVTVNIVYHVGSRHEVYGETGMAHLLEHLVFKGTPNHPNIPQELKSRGAVFNGTTYFDRTNYFETVPASDENLTWALDLEADRMINSYIARKDLDTEMTVVRNEFEIGESRPSRVLWQAVSAATFKWHNYGKSTIGSRSDLENVSIDRLQAFYRNYYQPDNATLVVAGKIDLDATLALITQKFGTIPKPARVLEKHYTTEPTQTGERSVTIRRTGDAPIALVSHRVVAAQHADAAPLKVLGSLLGTAPTGRLHQKLVATGKATSVSSDWYMGYDPGVLAVSAELRKQDNPDEVREVIISILSGFAAEPVTQAEVDRAKASFAAGFEAQRSDVQALAVAMTTPVGDGDWRLLFWGRDQIAKVTVADVQRVALHYFKRDNRTVGIFLPTDAPERAEIAPRVDTAALLKDYTGGAVISQGEDFDPSPANIDARTTTVALPNGLQVALLSKRTRGDRVQGQMTLRFGSLETLMGKGYAPGLLADLLTKGTQRLTRGALGDELTRLKATLSIGGGATSVTANFATTRDNLPAVLALVAECLRTPALAADEFEQIKRSQVRALEAAQKTPASLAGLRMAEIFNAYPKDHPSYVPTLAEQRARIDAVTLDDVKKFHAEFYGASYGQMGLVGSFDADAAKKQLETLLGDWKTPQTYTRLATMRTTPPPRSEVIVVPDQANATFNARLNFAMRDNDPEYPALVIANTIFGAGAMSSRLGDRLRQKEGLSYGSGTGVNVNVRNDAATFTIGASYAPAAADKLQAAVCEEVRRAVTDGFTEDEVARSRDGVLGTRRVARTNDGALAGALAGNLYNGRTMVWSADFDAKLKAVTAAQASAAFKRAVDPSKLVVIKAGTLTAKAAGDAERAPCGP
jgi:zinc protease